LFDTWGADRVIAERNFGGDMVAAVIRAVRRTAPITLLTASRGKVQRAEPVAALYEQGKVSHVGVFAALEDQLCSFSSSGYQGPGSPDRADANIWALTELMLNDSSSYDTTLKWVG
jgi:phage terminase large subunit-like protein